MAVVNIMEEVVRNALHEHLQELHLPCTCSHCLDDIMAITLNRLPPRYIANLHNSAIVRAEQITNQQGLTTVVLEIAKAAQIVSKNRRCSNR